MVSRVFGLTAGLVGILLVAVSAAAVESDERAVEANALLADEAGYERAITLFREVLDDRPDDAESRLRLARVLAWRGEYAASLEEYELLLGSEEVPATAAVERAEVISWSGQLDEAQSAFEALLAENPADARAARGLARVHAWAGRLELADESYARALALEDDPKAAQEHRHLRAGWRPWLSAQGSLLTDSDEFEWWKAEVSGAFLRTARTTLWARVAEHFVERPQEEAPPAARARHDSDLATEFALGVKRQLGSLPGGPVRLDLEAGARFWKHALPTPLAAGHLELPPWSGASLGIGARFGDQLDNSESFESLQRRLQATAADISLWQGLGPHWSVFGRYEFLWVLEDPNQRHSIDGNVSYRPFETWETRLELEAGWSGYLRRSDFYYDPSSDVSARFRVRDDWELLEGLRFEPSAAIGYGASRDGGSSTGLIYEVSGELSYRRGNWSISAFGGRSESRRASNYTRHSALLRVTREFGL